MALSIQLALGSESVRFPQTGSYGFPPPAAGVAAQAATPVRAGSDPIANAIRGQLSGCEARSIDALAMALTVSRRRMLQSLSGLMASGEVEVLRPISEPSAPQDPKTSAHVFYRLIRPTDAACRWQQSPRLATGAAVGR